MKNKSFLNKLDELKSAVPAHLEVEKKLLPRLKFMGYLMYVLCVIALVYAMTVREDTPSPQEGLIDPQETEAASPLEMLLEEGELDFSPTEVLNFYLVGLIFASVGSTCFLIAWKKRKTLRQQSPADEPVPPQQ